MAEFVFYIDLILIDQLCGRFPINNLHNSSGDIVGLQVFFMSVQLSGGGVNNQYIPRWSGTLADEETSEANYYKEWTINILSWLVGHTER